MPIIGTGTLSNELGKIVPWSEHLFDAKKKTLLKAPSQTTSEEKPIDGLDHFLDKKRKPFKLSEVQNEILPGTLRDSSGTILSSPDNIFDLSSQNSILKNASVDSSMNPIAGTRVLSDSKNSPISWAGPLLDSTGTLLKGPSSVFDDKKVFHLNG
jgi:hypothetical protein